jgi:hypothetical protein
MKLLSGTTLSMAAILAAVSIQTANAAAVYDWGLETGSANATLTEGSPGDFSTTTPTGNAAPRALFSTASFGNIGDTVQLSGTVSFANTLGNQQFRFGLFNNNSHALGSLNSGVWTGADPAGWLGYIVEPGNAGGTTALYGRNGSGANAWLSTSGAAYLINGNSTPASPGPGSYEFFLSLSRSSATSVDISYAFTQTSGGSYSTSGFFSDSSGLSSGVSSFNAVGFLLNANTGAGTFTGVDVPVPEPSSASLAVVGLAALLKMRRGRARFLSWRPRRSKVRWTGFRFLRCW